MSSFDRLVVRARPSSLTPGHLWKATVALVVCGIFILARACGYDFSALARYAAYFIGYVALPGVVLLYALNRGPLSPAVVLALAVPTGFAVEIFSYLGLASMGARWAYGHTWLAWLACGLALWWRQRQWPVQRRISGSHAGVVLGLAAAVLGFIFMAASQMFAESPLSTGVPSRAIFHDWVYLVSRAAVIKNHWPLDDPSLSGTPLQYHYFMMVHAAAASATTGVEVTLVLLRLMIVPLGAVLVAQVYLMGRRVSRSPWGGVLAALLLVVAGEASYEGSYGQSMFLGLFSRWIFVSPTFFFGMIYCGALLIAVAQCDRLKACGLPHYAWVLLLAAAGTGAKGTVLPVLICALGLWFVWRWASERRFPVRLALFGCTLGLGFAMVYLVTMSSWRTGDAAFRPLHVFQLTEFWKTYLPAWQMVLEQWLPAVLAAPVAVVTCGLVVFAGTCGVRLLAVPYLFWSRGRAQHPLTAWLGAFFLASTSMGLLMELNSYGELYLILMVRLPMAVLAAAFMVEAWRRLQVWRQAASPRWRPAAGAPWWAWARRSWLGFSIAVLGLALSLQAVLWLTRNQSGFADWLSSPAKARADASMGQLQEALLWVRKNTEPDAVLVANACTPENMKKDHWGALDRTLTGVHFYYSALSERRLWFEGPSYIMDTTRARIRANLASGFFYRGRRLDPAVVSDDPCYILVDRSLGDGAKVVAAENVKVFGNGRIEIYRMPRAHSVMAMGLADVAQQQQQQQ